MDIDQPPIDYLALARSMGVPAHRIERAADIAPTIEAAIASREVSLVDLPIGVT
jgi:benzoylformate decarboxylase